jgi:hypothetical protein
MRCPSNTPGESFPRLAGQDAAQAAVDALAASSRPFKHHHPQVQGRISRCSKERGRPRPQASPRPTLSFGLAKRWVAKNGMDSPANNPPFLSANPRQRFQGRARSADALVRFALHDRLSRWGWQKDRWQKTGSFSCPHSPANDLSDPFCHSV